MYFGKSDSKNEVRDERGDFVKSFVNLRDVVDQVVSGDKTLVLGPKGTGKSALAWYLYASQSGQTRHLTLVRDASELPLADIPQLETGQAAGTERTVSAWKFILLCNYLDLVQQDQSAHLPNPGEVARVTRLLRQYGLMGSASGRAIVNLSKTKISIPIPKVGTVYERETQRDLTIYALLPYLEQWAANTKSGNRHVLFIDGLDSIFLNDRKYDESLAALVQAAYSVNQKLSLTGATGSIVLLLRNDVFNRVSLTLPDSQKMRDDLAVELDWRVLSGAAGDRAPLLRLVNDKAARALGLQSVSVLDYFPRSVELGGSHGREPRFMPTLQYLLNLTRHTPRDLLRLFDEIRIVEESGVFPESQQHLRQDVIREGTLQYANKYFVGAIRNEFAGYDRGPEEAEAALAALQGLQRQKFTAQEFTRSLTATGGASESAERLLRLLFFAGAIGNVIKVNSREGSYMQFYHRRDDSAVYTRGPLIIHGALCHAWNIPFSV